MCLYLAGCVLSNLMGLCLGGHGRVVFLVRLGAVQVIISKIFEKFLNVLFLGS